jgi:uracil-DNA glycosylase
LTVTLEELEESASGCTGCALAERRTNVVFGEGNPLSPLVLVGEGPGDQEDKTGRPFIGKAGQCLDRALGEAGLSRGDVYICNTVKCRAADWSSGKPVNRPPTELETQTCRQWLIPQLGLIRPQVVLCIGGPSAKNLIRKNFLITKERGTFQKCEFSQIAMATLHPAYILRNAYGGSDGGFSLLVADIRRAWETARELVAQNSQFEPELG